MQRKGIPVILNPAPARKVSQQILDQAAYITPNEHEAALMFDGLTIAEALRQYPNKLLITEGKMGFVTLTDQKKCWYRAIL